MSEFLKVLMAEYKREYLEVCLELGYRIYKKYDYNMKKQRHYVTSLNQLCRVVGPRITELLQNNYYYDYQGMMIHAAQGDNLETLIYVINISHYSDKDITFDNHKLIRTAIRYHALNVVNYLLNKYPILNPCARGKRLRNFSVVKIIKSGDQEMINLLMRHSHAAEFIKKFLADFPLNIHINNN